jgi:hypothetical protein
MSCADEDNRESGSLGGSCDSNASDDDDPVSDRLEYLKEWLGEDFHPRASSSNFRATNGPWWPGKNFTSIAMASWQAWARLSNDKLYFLLKLLKTGLSQRTSSDPDLRFRLEDVPTMTEIGTIVNSLPRTKVFPLKAKRVIESRDASSKSKVVSESEVQVSVAIELFPLSTIHTS